MNAIDKADVINELRGIPGVGPSIAEDLWSIGLRSVADLRGCEPEDLWRRIGAYQGELPCRCVLYTMRCAVYYASQDAHDPEKLKWWNWKD